MNTRYIWLLVVGMYCQLYLTQAILDNYLKQKEVTEGMIFPREITAQLGTDVSIRLVNPFSDQESCQYQGPKSNVNSQIGSENRVIKWEQESCGIIVKNITMEDTGFWRLVSKKDNDFVRASLVLTVVETPEDSQAEYCILSRPDQDNFPMEGACEIPDEPGMWTLRMGIPGSSKEIVKTVYNEPKVEKIQTNIVQDSKELHLSCNLIHSKKMIKVCRFVRVNDGFALHMRNGIGTDGYRYYGKGLSVGECGITVEEPTAADRAVWKCFIKAGDDEIEKDFGSILDASSQQADLIIHPVPKKVLVKGSEDRIMCQANAPIKYCWFQQPDGQIVSLTEKSEHYVGLGFGLGDCGLKITAVGNETGTWRCSVGRGEGKFEAQQKIVVEVRSTDPLIVSEVAQVNTKIGESFKIECMTNGIHVHEPIDSCHFVTPQGTGFSLDETVTSDKALGDYYFNPNRSLKDGYCSLIVKKAKQEHDGTWKCFGRSDAWDMEGSDMIRIRVAKGGKVSVAGTGIGIAIGLIFIFVGVGVAFNIYRKRQSAETSLEMLPSRPSIASSSSSETTNSSTSA